MDSGDRFPLRNATSQEIMWKNITHLEERLAHDEVTRIYGLQWRLLTRNLTVVHEPDPALSWIWQSKRPTWPGSCAFGPVDEIPPPKRNISDDHQTKAKLHLLEWDCLGGPASTARPAADRLRAMPFSAPSCLVSVRESTPCSGNALPTLSC